MAPNILGANNFVTNGFAQSSLADLLKDFNLPIKRFYSCGMEDYIQVVTPVATNFMYCYIKLPCVIDVGQFYATQSCNGNIDFGYSFQVDNKPVDYANFPMDLVNVNNYITLSMNPLVKQNGKVYNVTLTVTNPYLYFGVKIYMFDVMI